MLLINADSTMKAVAVLSVLALIACKARTLTHCYDTCKGGCSLHKKSCDSLIFFDIFGVCDKKYNACTEACTTVCSCLDTCATQCSKDPCRKTDGFVPCAIDVSICSTTCQAECNFKLVAGFFKSVWDSMLP
ncbi:hypothetical protein PoB_004522200 [Plakobranchus ocellatus]|uniref:Uncharacterized protein n=1 Tax=Plakobranchus ocellatus TaxID=259542 RepID=A0AAV4BHG4_9GAST|nr:hypothetical protein PoB_004522200 [Plakobranchus ocellatus]